MLKYIILSRREVKIMAKAGKGQRLKNPSKVIKRLLSYLKGYRLRFIVVLVCIVMSAAASALSSMFMQTLIDDYIMPLMGSDNPDFSNLLRAIIIMAAALLIGALAGLAYNRIMVVISQGIQKKIRDQLFAHMQTLPIKYFDTHAHGDIMSRYTNDIDTLRQMMSASLPQMFASAITIITVFVTMLSLNL